MAGDDDVHIQPSKTALNDVEDMNMKTILLNDIRGKKIYEFYQKNKNLTTGLQELLVDVILDHIFNKDAPTKIPVVVIEKLANQICLFEDRVNHRLIRATDLSKFSVNNYCMHVTNTPNELNLS